MQITAKWFQWLNLQEQKIEQVQAWQRVYLELLLSPDLIKQWQGLELFLQHRNLPLMLRKGKNQPVLMAEWPAMNVGFCTLSLYLLGRLIAKEIIFVKTDHLETEQWVQLLQDLRYRLPARCLLKVRQSGSSIKLKTQALPGDPLEDAIRLRHAIETPIKSENLLNALQILSFRPHCEAKLTSHWQKLHAAKKPNLKHLAQQWNQSTAMILDQKIDLSIHIPINQFIAALSIQLQAYLRDLIHYSQQTQQFELAEDLDLSLKKLHFAWQKHPFRSITPQLKVPEHTELLYLPEYKLFFRLWQTLGNALQANQIGKLEWAYQDLSSLYQHWCLLQIVEQLLDWAQKHQWQVIDYQFKIQRGQTILSLNKHKQTLTLQNETSYHQHGEFISLSHAQRPDISLKLQSRGQSSQLMIFESKFRTKDQNATKEDIDKLHTYRDAIRNRKGQTIIKKAVLLYPGLSQIDTQELELWHMVPNELQENHFERILRQWFQQDSQSLT